MNVWAAIWDRLSNDATLVSLVGVDETGELRSYPEWPRDDLDETDFPRLTVTLPTDQLNRAISETAVQLDVFGYDLAVVKQIDDRLATLLHEQVWSYDGNRIYSWVTNGGGRPAAWDEPFHFMREIELSIS
jgi:hypothetical protein